MVEILKKYFRVSEQHSTVKNEIIAGITNYFTVIYLVLLVPEILIGIFPEAIGTNGELIGNKIIYDGVTVNGMLVILTAASFIAAGIGTLLIGIFINVPFAQGPSLAVGTFVTYTVCVNFGYTFNQALAIIFIAGICFFILSVCGLEEKLHRAIPNNIKFAVTAGIGLFIAYTGLEKAHIIHIDENSKISLFNIVDFQSVYTRDALLTLVGIVLIVILIKKGVHGAIFVGKILCIILALPLGLIKTVEFEKFEYSLDLSKTFFSLDFSALIDTTSFSRGIFSLTTIIILVFSICIMDIFETMSTFIATKNFIKVSNDKSNVTKKAPRILEIDSISTCIGALVGSSTISTYVESTTGVVEGGRTGLTAVVTGILFLISVFFSPFVSIIPSSATATTLIMAGIIMINVIKYINFEDVAEAVPAFFTFFIIPITKSLIIGISFGIIFYVIINICIGKRKKIKNPLYILAILFIIILMLIPR
ncbi:MAG: NCS2 family permease [Clostridiales bacterium]|jgi:AGZA family xanthine/uracil permease-like MFS transporter|nr:NCS2 family permease [Clostridiales bacterium]